MPRYTFEDTRTGDVFDIEVSINEYEEFKSKNPHVKQRFDKVYVGTVSNDFEWHYDKGMKKAFEVLGQHHGIDTGKA